MHRPKTLLLTRPERQSAAFARALDAALPGRFAVTVSPMTRISPTGAPLDLADASGLLFTSANGVEQFAARGIATALPAYCVGAMTAAAARAAGLRAESAGGDVAALAALAAAAHRPGDGPLVHIRGRHAAGDLIGLLAARGVPARPAEIYAQEPEPLGPEAAARFAGGRIDVVALFSPRSSAALAAAIVAGGWPVGDLVSVAISPAADAAFAGLSPGRRVVAEAPGRAGLIAALAGV
ncbi:MAG: uroporphyrinogen-III synthase [Rhodovulum sulfidophilum]|uniref:Uroporphyrinogen-III synthase n=1 Tax=Rhodovulum sulfidophilum TaxID=35806 RepID=A0A2W5N7F6_RHOSU|nr:MAG: uroporphyrinogen-III synthase [Rhodovulum sulfidophilum]